jgi:hypothetical protein
MQSAELYQRVEGWWYALARGAGTAKPGPRRGNIAI